MSWKRNPSIFIPIANWNWKLTFPYHDTLLSDNILLDEKHNMFLLLSWSQSCEINLNYGVSPPVSISLQFVEEEPIQNTKCELPKKTWAWAFHGHLLRVRIGRTLGLTWSTTRPLFFPRGTKGSSLARVTLIWRTLHWYTSTSQMWTLLSGQCIWIAI